MYDLERQYYLKIDCSCDLRPHLLDIQSGDRGHNIWYQFSRGISVR